MSAAEKVEPSIGGNDHAETPASTLSAAVRRVLDAMERSAIPCEPRKLPEAIRSPEEIADFCDCEINFIALTTVFRGKTTKKPVLLVHSAASKMSEKAIGHLVGENIQRADADFVQRLTGYPIDCVPPLAHLNRVPVMFDGALMRFARIWCPGGSPDTVLSIPTLVIARAISARIVQLNV